MKNAASVNAAKTKATREFNRHFGIHLAVEKAVEKPDPAGIFH